MHSLPSPLGGYVEEKEVCDIPQFAELLAKECPGPFVFRGHSDASWELSTSLERFLLKAKTGSCRPVRGGFEQYIRDRQADAESALLSEFRRGAHHYPEGAIGDGTYVEWLAMMQQYGTPTRLLDWTESPYAAMYFALEGASNEPRCIWALNAELLKFCRDEVVAKRARNSSVSQLAEPGCNSEKWPGIVSEALEQRQPGDELLVTALRPRRMNRRMIAQQGLFLVPLRLRESFEANLLATLRGWTPDPDPYNALLKINLPKCRDKVERMLDHLAMMNVSHATLYPGLDGFAYSVTREYERRGLQEKPW